MTEQKSMFDILSSMDAGLFERSLDLDEYPQGAPEQGTGDSVLFHDEHIDKNTARRLLGEAFDEACDYKLVTTYEDTCLVKIDPRIPADADPVLDEQGRVIGGHRVEIPLSSNDEVLSYGDMMSMISNGNKKTPTDLTYRRDIYDIKIPKPIWLYVVIGMISVMFIGGFLLLSYLT